MSKKDSTPKPFHPAAIDDLPITTLRPYRGNARTHSDKQIKQIANSIKTFCFTNPVLISDANEIIAGHGRVLAAKQLGLKTVPTIRLSHLSESERRAYILADNKLALNAGWDQDILSTELQFLIDTEFDLSLTGFSLAETDFILDSKRERSIEPELSPADAIPEMPARAVSRHGDLWLLGNHRLLCGDAREKHHYRTLLREG